MEREFKFKVTLAPHLTINEGKEIFRDKIESALLLLEGIDSKELIPTIEVIKSNEVLNTLHFSYKINITD